MVEMAEVDPDDPGDLDRLARLVGYDRLEPFSSGGESTTYRVLGTDLLVTVPRVESRDVDREVQILAAVASRVTVAVPEVVRVVPELRAIVVRRLPGVALMGLPVQQRADLASVVSATVGRLLAQLHRLDPASLPAAVPVDEYTPNEWRDEAAQLADELKPMLTAQQRDDVRRFLARPAPSAAAERRFSHNDLGIEHVLVTARGRVSGVIDWGDAAVTDPAYDFGLLLRDLGPTACAAGLDAYAAELKPVAELMPAAELLERAAFYARCKLLEDLAFGHADDQSAYVEKSLRAWRWTFG